MIRYAPLGEMQVYEISEGELEKLADGPPGQLHLNFALALLPSALTVFITLQTVEIRDNRTYFGCWIAFWLLGVQGLISLTRWLMTAGSIRRLVRDIRSRMPEKIGTSVQIIGPIEGGGADPAP